jgi:putative colanic acid biosynthesis acetyltransferase WcaF
MSNLDIEANRKATKYSNKELFLRVIWSLVRPTIFALSPRPAFGFRRFLLQAFGAKVGKGVCVYGSSHIYYPWNLIIGDHSSIGEWALIYNLGPISIGKRSTISQRVHLCAGTHDYNDPTMRLLKPPITIGDEVWICADAFVGPNVQLADRCIIGARAVVMKSIDDSAIVAGNPAVRLKARP